MSSKQITMVCLDQLISSKHQYRKFKDLFDFSPAVAKNQFAEFMNGICFNLKRLTVMAT